MRNNKFQERRYLMKKTVAILLVILMLFSLFQGVSRENVVKAGSQTISDGLELFYTVTVEKDNPTFHVSIKVENLYSGELIFRFFTVRANLEQYISNLRARDQTKTLTVVYLGDFRWKVYQNGGTLFIDYDVAKIIPAQAFSFSTGSKEVGVYIDNEGGIFWAQYVFMVPESDIAEIKIKFNLLSGWQLVTPYVEHEGYYEVPKITNFIDCDFVKRTIYFGKMKYYAESKTGNCTVKFGVLEEDQSNESRLWLTKEDVKFYTDRVVLALNELTKMFGENPFPVFPVTIRFMSRDEWFYQPCIFGEVQYWPPDRYDETLGHLYYSWMRETFDAPTGSNYLICKGIGESYLGNKLAYKITGDKAYLGKIYHYYLVYKGAQNTKYSSRYEIHDEYYRGCLVGLWLDNLVQKETGGKNSIEDVIGYLYQKYKNTGHEISNKDLEEATDLITKQNNSVLYKKYVDGEENIPVDEYMQPYKESFEAWLKVLESDNWGKEYRGYSIPFFVDVEMATRSPIDLPFSILILSHHRDFAKYMFKNYDVDKITKNDVETALSKLTGEDCTGFFERWKDSYGELSLEEMKEWLKTYLPYAPKNLQAQFKDNSVRLSWDQVKWRYPSGYYEIIGYAIYRGTSKGQETLIATVPSNSYTDTDIELGKTYYYYVKSIENLFEEMKVYSEPSEEVNVICKDTSPPEIFIYSPSDNFKTNENTITVSGTILDKESGIDKVMVNGNVVSLSSYGSFGVTVNIAEGVNKITIIAIDKAGNQTTKTLNVTYKKPVQTIIIILRIDQTSFTVNGISNTLDSPPLIKNSRTLLPIRAVIESLDGSVGWDPNTKKVTVTLGSNTIELWIGKNTASVNGVSKLIDLTNAKVVSEIINGRTMLPLRFITENLGCDVQWNGTTKTITITYSGS